MNSLYTLDIPRKSSHCCLQGERFEPGMEMYSLLLEEESEKLSRRDYCSVCWNEGRKESDGSRTYWKSVIERKKNEKDLSRIERGVSILRELLKQPDPNESELYVLCLFLARARQVALRQEYKKEGISYQMYEIIRYEEFLTVKVISLSDVEIEIIQKSLAEKFNEK
jgi:hypothetical protein